MSQKSNIRHSHMMKTQFSGSRGFILPLLFILMAAAVVAVGYGFAVWNYSYSEGERAGVVQKFSKKGWLCKTWEGELNMVVLPGGLPEKFYFTVWDEPTAATINRNIGKRVALHYVEKVGLPTSCFGETRYYVNKLSPLVE
jgi:nitrate reductase NapE component